MLLQFLSVEQWWSPLAFFGLFLVHWMFFGLVILLRALKAQLLERLHKNATSAASFHMQTRSQVRSPAKLA